MRQFISCPEGSPDWIKTHFDADSPIESILAEFKARKIAFRFGAKNSRGKLVLDQLAPDRYTVDVRTNWLNKFSSRQPTSDLCFVVANEFRKFSVEDENFEEFLDDLRETSEHQFRDSAGTWLFTQAIVSKNRECLSRDDSSNVEMILRGFKSQVITDCTVEWIKWYWNGSRRKSKAMSADGCTVTITDQTARVILPNGETLIKRTDAKGFCIIR